MKVTLSPGAGKQLQKLPENIKREFAKQVSYLVSNPRHPSLRSRKMSGEDKFESRIDYHNRFTYTTTETEIYIFTVGPHDEGLGKK